VKILKDSENKISGSKSTVSIHWFYHTELMFKAVHFIFTFYYKGPFSPEHFVFSSAV
jgi:hypothetical protein